ncbi:MAG: hypothetical protein FJ304_04285 [Planctomycetes bacterium]|nr:hypothetical protein [Planctomycetota bacterium]
MRPCRQCRVPIENRAPVCARCGATQEAAPRADTEPTPPPNSTARRVTRDAGTLLWLAPPYSLLLLVLPLAAVGYCAFGPTGATVGAVLALVVCVGALLSDSGG